MFGKLILKSNESAIDKAVSIYLLHSLPEIQKQNYLKKLYTLQEKNDINVFCGCKNVQMKILSENSFFYIDSEIGCKSKHDKLCSFSMSNKYKGLYEKGWTKEIRCNNYAYIPKLDNLYFTKKRYEKINKEVLDKSYFFDIKGNLTFRGFIAKINLVLWDNFVTNMQRTPENINEFSKYLLKNSSLFYPEKSSNKTVYDFLLPEQSRFDKISIGSKKFIYGEIVSLKSNKKDTLYLSDYEMKIVDSHLNQIIKIHCDGLLFSQAIERNNIKIKKDKKFIATGIIRFKQFGRYYVETLEIIPVTDKGLFVENLKELEFFKFLDENERLYKKEHCAIAEYYNNIPCSVLLDSNKLYITEIEEKKISNDLIKDLNKTKKLRYLYIDKLNPNKLPKKI